MLAGHLMVPRMEPLAKMVMLKPLQISSMLYLKEMTLLMM